MSLEGISERIDTPAELVDNTHSPIDGLSDNDKARYILQYLLNCRGVCHEDVLLAVLQKLQKNSSIDENNSSSLDNLTELVKKINVKLNPLNYKIVKVGHGMGKSAVAKMLRPSHSSQNNRFYLYINTVSSDESKLATRFSQREIEFIKWAVEQMCNTSECESTDDSPVIKELHRIRRTTGAANHPQCITHSLPSTYLLQYEEMSASEIDDLLTRLCELKWFYKDKTGRVAMDLRCIVELEEYLLSNGIPSCQSCHRLAVQGVQCDSCSMAWHIDCYQHYINHISRSCSCGQSLVENGVCVI